MSDDFCTTTITNQTPFIGIAMYFVQCAASNLSYYLGIYIHSMHGILGVETSTWLLNLCAVCICIRMRKQCMNSAWTATLEV